MNNNEYFNSAKNGLRPFSDFEWYSIDEIGNIAMFKSAGFGPVPKVVFNNQSTYWQFANIVEMLPNRCKYNLIIEDDGSLDYYADLAKKGIFAYDWDCGLGWYEKNRPYTLIAAPSKPLKIDNVESKISNWIKSIRFHSIIFGNANKIVVEEYFDKLNL